MKAAVFIQGKHPFEIREYPLSAPAANQAVVRLECSGICGTDVHIHEGALAIPGPMIIGHEFIGRVRALGRGVRKDCFGSPLRVGDRVIVNVIEPCGRCRPCKTGGAASCLNLGKSLIYAQDPAKAPHLHGGFAEATVVPTRYLHKLPAKIPSEVVASFLCAGATVFCGLRYAGGVMKGEHVVVQGSGPVGLCAAMVAKSLGAKTVTLIGSSSHPLRLELARQLGAHEVLDIRASSVAQRRERIMQITGGVGADMVFEGTGSPEAIQEGLGLLRNCGRYVWAGQYSNRGEVSIPPHLVTFNALRVFGSAQFTADDRRDYLRLLAKIPRRWSAIRRVITDRFRIEQINDAIAKAAAGKAIKAVLVPDASM